MEIADMNKGVQILLERMDSNPEEFYTDATKWLDLLGMVRTRARELEGKEGLGLSGKLGAISSCCLLDDEVIVLYHKLQEIQRTEFTNVVMKRLLVTDHPYNQAYSNAGVNQVSVGVGGRGGGGGGGVQYPSSGMLGALGTPLTTSPLSGLLGQP